MGLAEALSVENLSEEAKLQKGTGEWRRDCCLEQRNPCACRHLEKDEVGKDEVSRLSWKGDFRGKSPWHYRLFSLQI